MLIPIRCAEREEVAVWPAFLDAARNGGMGKEAFSLVG
jgi:hypothetical protein